jgi:hypothetical protein
LLVLSRHWRWRSYEPESLQVIFQPPRQPARRFGLGIHAQRHKRTDDFDH